MMLIPDRIKTGRAALLLCAVLVGFVCLKTAVDVRLVDASFDAMVRYADTRQMTDRTGEPLTVSYTNRWNTYDIKPLYEIPDVLKRGFVASEDKRFYSHHGVDWQARASAVWQNIRSGARVRGASTITEQVVRLVNPRPRTMWSKWLETIEAYDLDRRVRKDDILAFYLNQIPYASNRRGVVQAARYYFNRDLSTLTGREMLALVVMARAPSAYDLHRHEDFSSSAGFVAALDRLAAKLGDETLSQGILHLAQPQIPVNASHFAAYVRDASGQRGELHTTLDSRLQHAAQNILDERIRSLSRKNVHNGAVLVADHTTGDILAWVVAGADDDTTPAGKIDAVNTPRQPGSSLKPFLYAVALDRGWTAATMLDDNPVTEAIGTGLHRFKNYSNYYYGRLPLRETLANSLNIPAVLTIQHVGAARYLDVLHQLGFESLDQSADIYDDGLALGVGEVTLRELVQGYAALANKGVFRPLRFLMEQDMPVSGARVYTPEAASLIGNILSDPWARRLEFGNNSVLNMPFQTAAKTGTSTDYRDAWAVGFNDRYVVGIWMGNLDRTPTDGITGASGPALALRSIFAELNKNRDTRPLWLSPRLTARDICMEDPRDASTCYMRSEFFTADADMSAVSSAVSSRYELVKPTDGLQMAIDPRIPADMQKFEFVMRGLAEGQIAQWVLDGQPLATTANGKFLWPLQKGKHDLQVNVMRAGDTVSRLPPVTYIVK